MFLVKHVWTLCKSNVPTAVPHWLQFTFANDDGNVPLVRHKGLAFVGSKFVKPKVKSDIKEISLIIMQALSSSLSFRLFIKESALGFRFLLLSRDSIMVTMTTSDRVTSDLIDNSLSCLINML